MQRVIVSFGTKEELREAINTSKADEVRYMARNLFDGRVYDRATHIFSPHSKEIEDLYVQSGKTVIHKEESAKNAPTPEPVTEKHEVVEKHWSELSWPKMRSLATNYTDEPVTSKDQAKEILTAAETEGKI